MSETKDIVIHIVNRNGRELKLCLEPWGEIYDWPVGSAIDVVASGPYLKPSDVLAITLEEDAVSVWAWGGAMLSAFQAGKELGDVTLRPLPPTDLPT